MDSNSVPHLDMDSPDFPLPRPRVIFARADHMFFLQGRTADEAHIIIPEDPEPEAGQ